ncbi:MAG: AMP-binding protein, partial [Candidatus Dormibacteraeota bacterium]|nr:AMP-binding protein [Candidatus Dormibacteraeota bacterium]
MSLPSIGALARAAERAVESIRVLRGAGMLSPLRPDRLLITGQALRRWGVTIPGGFAAAAARDPEAIAVVDDRGEHSFAEIDGRTDAIAAALREHGLGEDDRLGILCRNHAGFVEALLAGTKVGADLVLLNTGFAAPQLADVLQREAVDLVVHDAEFTRLFRGVLPRERRILAWTDAVSRGLSLERLASQGAGRRPAVPSRQSRLTILTSGTTGTPKGAARAQPRSFETLVGVLDMVPLRSRQTVLIAAPLFHAWGLAHLGFGVVLRSTVVLQRTLEPQAVLAASERERVEMLAAVPVMLRRILELPAAVRRRYDLSSLQVVAVSGSALQADLATRFMDTFGDVVYNLYGSTEVAVATIATPQDLREAPGTVGRPPMGTTIRIVDDTGDEVGAGDTGRILVGNDLLFEGYTNGGGGERHGGMVATGDLGYRDADGRVFIAGRADDMIVSGGENVFPGEVEEALAAHPAVADVAVVGVDDDEWGQRLAAFVV